MKKNHPFEDANDDDFEPISMSQFSGVARHILLHPRKKEPIENRTPTREELEQKWKIVDGKMIKVP